MPLYLYNLTLQKATAVTTSIYGNFSKPNAHEIVVGRGKILELLRPDANGRCQSIVSQEVFGVIRSLIPFRLNGANKDYIVVGSDSGRIVILDFDAERNAFVKVHQETFGKSGCRRVVPGEYLAADPRGRAVMIGALEKAKLVYVLNRDAAANLTISSPLEAHKSQTLCFDMVGVDVGYENPIFAALEVDFSEIDDDHTGQALEEADKLLTFYELDLGLNHVVRKWSDVVDRNSNLLVTVPGGENGPGGVLVCSESLISWKNQGYEEVSALLPRRTETLPDRGVLIVSATMFRRKGMFFFLLHSEQGDLFKVTLDYEEDVVSNINIAYFDSIPPTVSLNVMRSGFLFAASEFGNHGLYQFQSLGTDADAESLVAGEGDDPFTYVVPRAPENLLLVDDVASLSPITHMEVSDVLNEGVPQLYTLCGRGARSSLRVLRHGLEVTEMALSDMPGNPNGVWTCRTSAAAETDSYIVVSFVDATMVLEVSDTVEESTDSGFNTDAPTLAVTTLGDDAIVQVHPLGIRHIRADKRINEWKTPARRSIVCATVNSRQVVIALSGGELMLFDLDVSGNLNEVAKRTLKTEVACLDVESLPENRARGRFVAVGTTDGTVRLLSLDPDNTFAQLALQALPSAPESVALTEMGDTTDAGTAASSLFLSIGLRNGVFQRLAVDARTGELSDMRSRFLGSRPVRLFRVVVNGSDAVLALSSRSWLSYNFQARFHLTPLSYDMLEHADSFASDACPEGVVAIAGSTLRIITLESLGEVFNQAIIPVRYTPRSLVIHPATKSLVTIETDHNAFSVEMRAKLALEAAGEGIISTKGKAATDGDGDVDMDGDGDGGEGESETQFDPAAVTAASLELEEEDRLVGAPAAGVGRWASCVRVYSASGAETLCTVELDENEAAFSVCTCVFSEYPNETNIVVGTAVNLTLQPRHVGGGFIRVYRLSAESQLELVHKTPVDDVPNALVAFQGRLVAGVGSLLRLYVRGKKKLLRKCELKLLPHFIMTLNTSGDRIVVGDIQESFHFVKYSRDTNTFGLFADDFVPRWVTAACLVDHDTVAGGDKFGNVFVNRLRDDTDETAVSVPASANTWERGILNGAPNKTDDASVFHVGEIVTTMSKASLVTGGGEVVIYGTIMGGIEALVPFSSREDVDFFVHLEMHMRQEFPPLCGRDHLSFRSYYFPVKDVIDGDLCEQFNMLDPAKQRRIAEELDRTPSEVAKKLEDMRNRNCM